MTARTPRLARMIASSLLRVMVSFKRKKAKGSTSAGVADVTSEPFAAVDSLVPIN